jgi:hypothetical protein
LDFVALPIRRSVRPWYLPKVPAPRIIAMRDGLPINQQP